MTDVCMLLCLQIAVLVPTQPLGDAQEHEKHLGRLALADTGLPVFTIDVLDDANHRL